MNKRITSAVAVYAIFENNDKKVLIARRCNTGYQDGMYQIPAGHVEKDELPTDALIREVREEVGVNLEKKHLKLVHVSARPRHDETGNRIDFFYMITFWFGTPTIMEPNKCDDLRWSDYGNLPENTTPHVKLCLKYAKEGRFSSEFDMEWLKSQPAYGIQ
jgi:ADP-ribose pyrophosphatase YjhB (NUDIX family)